MQVFDYKNFVKKLANELRGKSSESIRQRLEQLCQDIKREIQWGSGNK